MRGCRGRSFGVFLIAGSIAAHAQAPQIPAGPHVVLGRVVDLGTDAPVGGATITLMGYLEAGDRAAATAPRGREREAPAVRHVMATADGYFVVHNLPPGQYALGVRAFGYVNSDYPPHIVEVVDGERLANVVLRLWKFAAIGGRVIDERGEPVTGIPVVALRRQSIEGALVLQREIPEVVTDDRGVYRIAPLTPGEYVVGVMSTAASLPAGLAGEIDALASNPSAQTKLTSEIRRNGYFALRSGAGQRIGDVVLQRSGPAMPLSPRGRPMGYANTLYPGARSPAEATVITLGSGESRDGVDIPIRFAETVSVSGSVTGPAGPIGQLPVHLVPPGISMNDLEPVGIATAITDGAGAFTFPAVVPGDFTVGALRFEGTERVDDGATWWAAQPLTVADEDVAGFAVTLRPGVRVSGRVEFTDGPPILPASQRVFLSLQPFGAQSWRTQGAVMRPDGTFTTSGDPPGRYVINVSRPPGWTLQRSSLGGTPLTSELIELGDRDVTGLVLTLAQSTTRISGTVTTAAGALDPNADVVVFPVDAAARRAGVMTSWRISRTRATSTGSYQFTGLAPGEYYVAAVAPGAAFDVLDRTLLERLVPRATTITLGAGETRTVALKTIALSGR